MRQFVVRGHEAPTTADFSLDDLPGAGRLDVLCRCVTAAFLLSHDIRADVRVRVVLDGYTVHFEGRDLKRLNPDERSTAALFKAALDGREKAVGRMPVETTPGVSITRHGFESTLRQAADEGTVVQLHADGTPAIDTGPPTDPVFVLSDHRSFTEEESDTLTRWTDRRVSLSPRRLHGDQAVTVAHNWLDTEGFASW